VARGKAVRLRIGVTPDQARFRIRKSGTSVGLDVDEYGKPIHAINSEGKPVCGCILSRKNDGKPPKICQSPFRMANGRCRKHGGATPRGIMSPNYKHGKGCRYARVLAPTLQEVYEEIKEKEKDLSVSDDISLTKVRLVDLPSNLEDGLSRSDIPSILTLAKKAQQQAQSAQNPKAALASYEAFLQNAEATLTSLLEQQKVWGELFEAQKHLASLMEYEQRRLERIERQMSERSAFDLLTRMAIAVKARVSSPGLYARGPKVVLAAIAADFNNLVSFSTAALPPGTDPSVVQTFTADDYVGVPGAHRRHHYGYHRPDDMDPDDPSSPSMQGGEDEE